MGHIIKTSSFIDLILNDKFFTVYIHQWYVKLLLLRNGLNIYNLVDFLKQYNNLKLYKSTIIILNFFFSSEEGNMFSEILAA